MMLDEQNAGAARHPEETNDGGGEIIPATERGEGVGEFTPLPEDAGGDTPPERDLLAELEAAVGRNLSDDLTAEATHLSGDDSAGDEPAFRRYAGS